MPGNAPTDASLENIVHDKVNYSSLEREWALHLIAERRAHAKTKRMLAALGEELDGCRHRYRAWPPKDFGGRCTECTGTPEIREHRTRAIVLEESGFRSSTPMFDPKIGYHDPRLAAKAAEQKRLEKRSARSEKIDIKQVEESGARSWSRTAKK